MPRPLRQLLTGRVRFLVLFFAGAALSLALPPLGWFWVSFLVLPVAVFALDVTVAEVDRKALRLKRTALAGWAFGFGYFVVSLYWIGAALLVEADKFALLLPFAVIALPAGLALFWAFGFFAAGFFWQAGWGRVLLFAIAMSSAEWLRGHVLTGFPWNLLGTTVLHMGPVAEAGAVVGVYGLTFLALMFGACPVVLFGSAQERRTLLGFGSALVLLAVVTIAARQDFVSDAKIQPMVRIVQPNIPQDIKWKREHRRAHISKTLELVARDGLDAVNIVVLPESALPLVYERSPEARRAIASLLGDQQFLFMGGIRLFNTGNSRHQLTNAVLVVGPNGRVRDSQNKRRLVPFGEYLPFKSLFSRLGLRKLVPVPDGFVAGDKVKLLKTNGGRNVLALICYEVIFPFSSISIPARPDWIVNVTNDAWFGNTAGPHQHLAMARMRAIETGIPVIRAANTGISAVIDARGKVVAFIPLNTTGLVDRPLPRKTKATVFWFFGGWTFVCILIISLLLTILSRVSIRKS